MTLLIRVFFALFTRSKTSRGIHFSWFIYNIGLQKQVYVGFPSLFSGLFGRYVNELHSSFALQKASYACHGSPGSS